ncbi:hypothetical protein LBBP_02017 [Leptospira borgpetersenii serovar Ballum]|uniref:Uncharacterized protein n=1 Tax=Leptospira borgpetersenii serovar Ballum TaxID=280505 RepID=A0A0S2IRK5_LEPBO|nr:hypothetical protein LBBP_02017 [Leptospira borgpetersenii serovar Ballum]
MVQLCQRPSIFFVPQKIQGMEIKFGFETYFNVNSIQELVERQ